MELKDIIDRINNLKNEVDSCKPLKPEQEQRLLQKIRLDWNFHSSHIEGNSLTFGETKALVLWGITAQGKPLRDHLEIKGHNEVVEYVMDIIKGKEITINESFIREFHKIIIPEEYLLDAQTEQGIMTKRKIIPGKYKTNPNSVITSTGEIFEFATPEETPAKMMDLMNWYKNETEKNDTHPLIIASMFHYNFVRIHPFDDGNGRMSRILMNIVLMKYGFPPVIINTDLKSDYLNSLQYADQANLDKFIIFIGERLIESLNLILKVSKNESIDDENDIDKMILIIKNKMEWGGMDEEFKIEKSNEVITSLYGNFIEKMINKFIYDFSRLIPFFSESKLLLWFNNSGFHTSKELLNKMLLEKLNSEKVSNIGIEYTFYNLIDYSGNLQEKPQIKIEFNQYYYTIKYNTYNEITIKKRYHQQLEDKDIDKIVNDLFALSYNLIEKNIDEKNKQMNNEK